MKHQLLAVVAALTVSSIAYAADLPTKHLTASGSASQVYEWSGAYLGLNGGYGRGKSDITNVQFGSGTLYPYPDEDGSFKMTGGLVGGQLGYNHQSGNLVFGLEADFDYANIKGTYAFPEPNPINLDGKLKSVGTVRARFGYAVDNILVFVTGGVAYGSTKALLTSVAPPVLTASASKSYTGYAIGGGVEYGLTRNWSIKAEYLHIDFGKKSNTYVFTGNVAEAVAATGLKSDIVRLGVNYRF